MARKIINSTTTVPVTVLADDEKWLIGKNGTLDVAAGPAFSQTVGLSNLDLVIAGTVNGGTDATYAIELLGAGNRVTVAKGGEVVDTFGAMAISDATTLINNGSIDGGAGIGVRGNYIRNNGSIAGDIAVYETGFDSHVVNGEKGTISGAYGIAMQTANTGSYVVINHGTITGTFAAIKNLTDNNLKVVNDGTLNGETFLGGGDDTFIQKAGASAGLINGGLGDDVFIFRGTGATISEQIGGGTDTLRTFVSIGTLSENVEQIDAMGRRDLSVAGNNGHNYMRDLSAGDTFLNGMDGDDQLVGGRGHNTLAGGAGSDTLVSNAGNDTMTGGAGDADFFHIATKSGHDVITDFEDTLDKIYLTVRPDLGSVADLALIAIDDGPDVLIKFSNGDSLRIEGLDFNKFTTDDVIFI